MNYPEIQVNQPILRDIAKAIQAADSIEDIADLLTTLEHLNINVAILTEYAEQRFGQILDTEIKANPPSEMVSERTIYVNYLSHITKGEIYSNQYLARKLTAAMNRVRETLDKFK